MNGARARLVLAQAELERAAQQLHSRWQPWRSRLHRHRAALFAAAGLTSGFAVAALPWSWWSRIGGVMLRTALPLARSAALPSLLGSLWPAIFSSRSTPRQTP